VTSLESSSREEERHRLEGWQQGDVVLGEHWFPYRFHRALALTEAAWEANAEPDIDIAEQRVAGFAVVTQTCDLVRDWNERPFVELCALLPVEPEKYQTIVRGYRPTLAAIPGVGEHFLVADLDRVCTVEKPWLAQLARIVGCRNNPERRNLASALARKRSRVAFPDDFVELIAPLRERVTKRHDRQSDEGRALRALREIRVLAAPSWEGNNVRLSFYFLRNDDAEGSDDETMERQIASWMKLVVPNHRFTELSRTICTIDDLTAREYVESEPLDLEFLSQAGR
jgi:hypothetical protein